MATILHLRLYTRTIRLEHVMQIAYFMPKEADFTIPKSNADTFNGVYPEKGHSDNLLKFWLRKSRIYKIYLIGILESVYARVYVCER